MRTLAGLVLSTPDSQRPTTDAAARFRNTAGGTIRHAMLDELELEDLPEIVTDPRAAAEAAGLRYVSEAELEGISRRRCGQGFVYLFPDGTRVPTRSDERLRIEELAIPPAWTEVWIALFADAHIQATGRDDKGRKQYLYHERWSEIRSVNKFARMVPFALALPRIRERVDADLRLRALSREKVLAIVVELLQDTLIRIGNLQYAVANRSFGLTTLQNHHVRIEGSRLRFQFRGKSGKIRCLSLHHPRLAKAVEKCRELPGHLLFQYLDDQKCRCRVDSGDVNDYLREITGEEFTAKDFRTWGGTVQALCELHEVGWDERATQRKRNVTAAIKAVSEKLGNTPAVCRQHYVHPAIVAAYEDNTLSAAVREAEEKHEATPFGLDAREEAALLILRRALATLGSP